MGGRGGSSHRGGGGGAGRLAGAQSFLERAYGLVHAQAILSLIQNAPAHIQELWEDFGASFRASRMNRDSDEAYYSPGDNSVHLGIDYVARGDSISTPYSTVFHEYGHMTDYLIARELGGGGYRAYSDIYKGGLLGSTAKRELEAHIARAQRIRPGLSREEAARFIISEARGKYSHRDRSDISDMMEGAGIGVAYPLGAGHGLNYWSTRGNSKEIFAEITSAEAAHPGSLKAIKDYFPETYKVYREMLTERKRNR